MTSHGREGWPAQPATPAPTFTPEAVARFEALLDDVLTGRVEVWHLPPALADWYWLGVIDGRDALQTELDQANADADRLYRVAFDPKVPQRLGTELLAHERAVAYRDRHKRGEAA